MSLLASSRFSLLGFFNSALDLAQMYNSAFSLELLISFSRLRSLKFIADFILFGNTLTLFCLCSMDVNL